MLNQRPYSYALKLRLALALGVLATTLALGQTNAPVPDSAFMRFATRDYLLGDWGGLRTKLKEHGVDFEFVYFGAVPSNLEGGIKEGSVYEGAFMMLMDLDSEKLVGYPGGQLHVGGLSIHNGYQFSQHYVGDLNKVSLLDFPDNLNLWELYYEQKLLDDRIALKVGQLAVDRDFIVPEFYNSLAGISLLNQTFFYPTLAFNVWDQPFFPVKHHALASTPYGAPGARLRVDPSPYAYFQVGAYAGNPDRSRGDVRFPISESEGALIYAESTLRINQTKDAEGPPGNLKVGGYYHTADFVDMYQGTFAAFNNVLRSMGQPPAFPGTAKSHSGNYGVYALADQVLWREKGKDDPAQQGLTGFLRLEAAPQDRNLASWGVDGGLVYKGLIPGRDWDTLALAGSYLRISDDLRDGQAEINRLLGAPVFGKLADYEAVMELSYKAQVTAWLTVQPSLQRVFHPGGRIMADIPDAWVVIVQAMLRL